MAETAFPLDHEEEARQSSADGRPSLRLIETPAITVRPQVRGKFIFVGEEKFWVKGVTYGTFAPDENGHNYPGREAVNADFAAMVASGINTVRLYTVPPSWLLDTAQVHGLRVMVGLPWEQHVAFLDDKKRAKDIERRVRESVRACAGHPAVLCYAVGNEIPASIVRWYGRNRIEQFIKRLYRAVKEEDPEALVTYVNFPTTEYLDLSFVDLFTFNVYLEDENRLASYLKRLHNIAGDKPVILAEVGLDTLRHGETKQSDVLSWQIRTCFAEGCCGVFVFAWTDDWHRGGYDIEDWDFGLTTRDRMPKRALDAVSRAFDSAPFSMSQNWPKISVVVCSLNGAGTIRDTLQACQGLNYPNYEVIVVSDGSTDATPNIAREYDVRLICTANQGLSAARNEGLRAATGEIIAYVDDDAYPDPDWLRYLANAFRNSRHVGVGGPNLLPPEDGAIAACVYNAPGGPVHVLLDDETAEHIPGCNMAFRKEALEAVGGFDPIFRAAGDDVDMCWRLQERGWTLGFSPSALVWHHRRNSIGAYWKQQQGYGKAEALLEQKWPGKYNAAGHASWAGRLYGNGLTLALRLRRERIYHGTWGSAPFQSIYHPAPSRISSLPLMPEWYLLALILGVVSLFGESWPPLFIFLPLLIAAVLAPVIQAFRSAARCNWPGTARSTTAPLSLFCLTAGLHLMQPAARLKGRIRHGLAPWRKRGAAPFVFPWLRTSVLWSERWRDSMERLRLFESILHSRKVPTRPGGDFDGWDVEVRSGLFGRARLLMAIEEHGGGRQLMRFRIWPVLLAGTMVMGFGLVALTVLAAHAGAVAAAWLFGLATVAFGIRAIGDCGAAQAEILAALETCRTDWTDE